MALERHMRCQTGTQKLWLDSMALSALSFLERGCLIEEEKHINQAHKRKLADGGDGSEVKGRKKVKEFVLVADRAYLWEMF